jgi:hypothetical protein
MAVPAASFADPELDLALLRRRLQGRWALIALAVVVAGAVGFALTTSGSRVFQSTATLYLPPAITPGGLTIPSLATTPSALTAVVRSDATLLPISRRTHLSLRELRSGVAAAPLGGTNTTTARPSPFFVISVKGPLRRGVRTATELLANGVLRLVRGYGNDERAFLRSQVRTDNGLLATLSATAAVAPRLGDPAAVAAGGVLGSERADLVRERTQARLFLAEYAAAASPSLVGLTRATNTSAKRPSISAVVAALVALILATAVALLVPSGGLVSRHSRSPAGIAAVRLRRPWWERLGEQERPATREIVTAALLAGSFALALLVALLAAASVLSPAPFLFLLGVAIAGLLVASRLGR